MKKRVIIGLTGGIGSGKSVAADILLGLNAYIIDADVIARQVLTPDVQRAIIDAVPLCAKNGEIDRSRLRQLIFSDKSIRKTVEDITHPLIFKRINGALRDGINIVVVPLLFESGFDKQCDYVLTISATEQTRKKRVAIRDGVSEESVQGIIDAQINQQQQVELSDFVIDNDGTYDSLKQKVVQWYKNIQKQDFY